MTIRTCFALLLLGVAASAAANPDTGAPVDPQAEAAYQVDDAEQPEWRLDPAIFTDISPVDVPEVAIKLPEDQQDDG